MAAAWEWPEQAREPNSMIDVVAHGRALCLRSLHAFSISVIVVAFRPPGLLWRVPSPWWTQPPPL